MNGTVPFQQFIKKCGIAESQAKKLQEICFAEKWSNRTHAKLIRIARTIADLNNETVLPSESIEEAVKWKRIASGLQNTTTGAHTAEDAR